MSEELYVKDAAREAILESVYARIRRNKSCLIVGQFGSGKSQFMGRLKPKYKTVIAIDSLLPVADMIHLIASKLGISGKGLIDIINQFGSQKNKFIILIDEADDIKTQVYSYLKRIMNQDISIILAGKPNVLSLLQDRFEDILSRLKVHNIQMLSLDDYKEMLKNKFTAEAVELIYKNCGYNMRMFDEIGEDCLDYISNKDLKKVTVEIATMFIR